MAQCLSQYIEYGLASVRTKSGCKIGQLVGEVEGKIKVAYNIFDREETLFTIFLEKT